jgi:hypothetical protein
MSDPEKEIAQVNQRFVPDSLKIDRASRTIIRKFSLRDPSSPKQIDLR